MSSISPVTSTYFFTDVVEFAAANFGSIAMTITKVALGALALLCATAVVLNALISHHKKHCTQIDRSSKVLHFLLDCLGEALKSLDKSARILTPTDPVSDDHYVKQCLGYVESVKDTKKLTDAFQLSFEHVLTESESTDIFVRIMQPWSSEFTQKKKAEIEKARKETDKLLSIYQNHSKMAKLVETAYDETHAKDPHSTPAQFATAIKQLLARQDKQN